MRNNKTVVIFLIKFFGTYLLLFLSYSFYLGKTQEKAGTFSCAPITKTVAKQTETLLNLFNYDVVIKQSKMEVSMELWLEGVYVAKIIEGCTSISIIILSLKEAHYFSRSMT